MERKPITVEVEVERAGCFVKVTRIWMCESVESAKDFKEIKIEVARRVMDMEGNADWFELNDDGIQIAGAVHFGKDKD